MVHLSIQITNGCNLKKGPNTLKHTLSQFIVDYAKKHCNCPLIISNSNRNRRLYLLDHISPEDEFTMVLGHFDIPDHVLEVRVLNSERNTNVFRSASTFDEVLKRQLDDLGKKDHSDPVEGETNHLFITHNSDEVVSDIVQIAE